MKTGMIIRHLVALLALSTGGHAGAQAQVEQAKPEAPAVSNSYQGNWDSRSLNYDSGFLLNTTITTPANANAWGLYFQNERNAALSTNNGTLSTNDKARLRALRTTWRKPYRVRSRPKWPPTT